MPPRETETQVAPDGGWGWLIVLGSSVINLFTRAIEPSFGLLFGDLLKQLGVATTGAAFIMSARDATINFSGFFMGPLLKNYSYRKVGVMGAILSSVGLMATASANSMTHILLTYSLIGVSCIMGPGDLLQFCTSNPRTAWECIEMQEQLSLLFNFPTSPVRRLVGTNLQPSKKPVDGRELQEENSLMPESQKNNSLSNSLVLQTQKSQSFLSIRCENTSMASLSHLDLTDSMLDIPMEGVKKDALHRSYHCINNVECGGDASLRNKFENRIREEKNEENKKQSEEGCWQKLVSIMDFDLLLDPTFLNILFGLSMAYLAEINFKLVIPFFMANLGYTKGDTAQALSLMAVADICARLLIPPIFDKLTFTRRNTLAFGLVFVMIARSVLAEQTSWRNLIITILIHGFFRGFALINFPLVVSEAVAKEKLPSAYGLFMVSKGIFVVILGPLVGWIRDYTGSYSICLHAQSAMIMVCVVSWTVEYFLSSRSKQRLRQSKQPS